MALLEFNYLNFRLFSNMILFDTKEKANIFVENLNLDSGISYYLVLFVLVK